MAQTRISISQGKRTSMTPQNPAHGISIDGEYKDAVSFNVECDCSNDDHAIKMWIEVSHDNEIPEVEVTFYVTTQTEHFWNNWWSRIKAVYDIIFKGVHKQQHTMLLNSQSALNLATAITKTVEKLEEKRLNINL